MSDISTEINKLTDTLRYARNAVCQYINWPASAGLQDTVSKLDELLDNYSNYTCPPYARAFLLQPSQTLNILEGCTCPNGGPYYSDDLCIYEYTVTLSSYVSEVLSLTPGVYKIPAKYHDIENGDVYADHETEGVIGADLLDYDGNVRFRLSCDGGCYSITFHLNLSVYTPDNPGYSTIYGSNLVNRTLTFPSFHADLREVDMFGDTVAITDFPSINNVEYICTGEYQDCNEYTFKRIENLNNSSEVSNYLVGVYHDPTLLGVHFILGDVGELILDDYDGTLSGKFVLLGARAWNNGVIEKGTFGNYKVNYSIKHGSYVFTNQG